MIEHFFTVDVEEHFQVNAFDGVVSRAQWPKLQGRLEYSIPILLDLLDRANTRGTFFVLGWVARHRADIVLQIARAGHEIASHGFWHLRVNSITPDEFRNDIRSSKAALEDLIGAPVIGYRAPSFSIARGCEWAFDVLLEEEYRYDSSIFPIQRSGYGYAGAPRAPHLIERASGTLQEFPLATTMIAGVPIPAAGGGYLRQFPFWLIRRAFNDADKAGVPATFYIHPWEIDPDQPRFPVGLITRLRHYRGLSKSLGRIQTMLSSFRFTSIASFVTNAEPLTTTQSYRTR